MQQLKDYRFAPLSGGSPTNVVIFLHGLGDSGSGGLLDIGRIWSEALPTTEFLCPDAPFAFDMAPPDFGDPREVATLGAERAQMRQWFSLADRSPHILDAGVRAAAPILDAYIDQILATRKIKPAQLALAGFSQGTMMALHVAPRRAEPIAAVVGYSGRLTCANDLKAEKKSTVPVLLAHGTADEMVPFTSMAEAATFLKDADIPVQTLACPRMGHSIDDAGLAAGEAFLLKYLS